MKYLKTIELFRNLHEIYVLIYLTPSKDISTCFQWFEFSVLISLLDLNTRKNMQNQDETVLMHYKKGVSVPVSKNIFYDKKVTACC